MKCSYLALAVALLAMACQGGRTRHPGGDAAAPFDTSMSADASADGSFEDADPADATRPDPDDAGDTDDAGIPDSSMPPTDASPLPDSSMPPRDTGTVVCSPAGAALAIVEVMVASQSGTDQGEWFEVANMGTCTVDLRGLVIGSPATDGTPVTHTVTMGEVAPGEHFVFALSGEPAENHELPFDYVYGTGTRADVFLGNSGDLLTVAYGGVELDRVAWTAEDFERGVSLQYPRGMSVTHNGDLARWCGSSRVYSTSGGTFYGTPGAPNGDC